MDDVHWKSLLLIICFQVLLLTCTAPSMVLCKPELRESPDNDPYDLCGNTTKCICVDTDVRKTIQCEGGRLRGQLPSKISVPPDYTAIDFSRDSIPFIKSDTFDGTYVSLSVVTMDFSNNDIEYVEDGAFEMFQALRELVLKRNRIANLTLGAFRNLRYLETLDLSYNNIAIVDMDVLYPCTALRRFSIRYNPLPLQGLQDLLSSASTNLEDLDLHGLNLDRLPDDIFRPVPYVQKIVLSGNRLVEVPGEALSRMRRLTVLDLSDNFVARFKDIDFQGLESLEELYLNRMRNLELVGQGSFATLRNLRIFSCSFNAKLRTIQEGAFPDPEVHASSESSDDDDVESYDELDIPLPQIDGSDSRTRRWHLEEIHLRQNALPTLSESLLPWDQIRYVDLSENPWKCDCRLQWMKRISWDMHRAPPIRCEMPISARRRLITEIAERDFRCETSMETHLAVSVVLLLATMCFLLTSFCLFAFFHKPACFNVCRAIFQRRYSKLHSMGNGRHKSNNNVHDVTQDVEMSVPAMRAAPPHGDDVAAVANAMKQQTGTQMHV